ncbi:MAG: 30S ribosomal protein S17 [Kiritimatiellia bacterium]
MSETTNERASRKTRRGIVATKSGDKTIVVRVERRYPHPVYGKVVKAYAKFHTHDENNTAKIGDTVIIMETRPLSKTKRWRLVSVEEK